ncbi:uncharacterized protein TRIVIDRAFT_218445 [Trichoderma virens Gv29-8]|uniref:Uncharacterized protein n=1 Tax=Hypocrea virens (strain Gv29-8 / FGSC 10586) TaxID=413071 RepID=G9MHT9_HYPVG|nr:uncharacterized protein TRIVIDRAFT_218445 [Trichoderma virens Gv29-8]EHK26276.1 hypothetical protein TRIVIDRAFT_218445 [Trichoderma virens Gv29-8]UKZ46460.1 hypothetical protein TrVGV298_000663 [Trichoderma virens]
MAFWTAPFRVEPTVDRDANMFWQGADGLPSDASSDLFGQFVDFDGDSIARTPVDDGRSGNSTIGSVPDSFFMNQAATGTASSVVSSADEFDFFSTTAANHGLDAQELAFGVAADPATGGAHQFNHLSRKSMSETELQRLENISLHSPQKNSSVSRPPSPTPPNTSTRRPKKLVEALSSTIRKATTLGRRSRKQQQQQPPIERSASPTLDHPPMAIKSRAARMHSIAQSSVSSVSHESPSPTSYDPGASSFIHGFCDDPFAEPPRVYHSPSMQYYNHGGMDPTPMHSSNRRIKSEQHLYQAASSMMGSTTTVDATSQAPQQAGWQQQMMTASAPEPWGSTDYGASQDSAWWDLNINASMNQAMHSQHGELPYEYAPIPDTGAAGLMIHMPQPRPPQPAVVNDIGLTAQTYLPPPPPIPTDRCSRPPRAPSSGARHRNLSSSPMRKTRGPSASPTPAQAQMRNQSRHSSTGSISSVRSASGRGPGSAPNTPGGVRKRRSRDAGAGSGIGLAGDGIGFVNFTPNDGSILMTGVAPSGSSKTKARREKEAQEKRRRLSEAAMKAVAAAGGDVDKLIQEGFVF